MDDSLYSQYQSRYNLRNSLSRSDQFRRAKMGTQIALAGAKMAYDVYQSRKRQRTEGRGNEVALTTNHEHRDRKGYKKFGRMSIGKRLSLTQSSVVYRWQSWSPYHSTYASIPMINGAETAIGASDSSSVQHSLPMYMFDITSAPNALTSVVPANNATSVTGLVQNQVCNYNPAWRFFSTMRSNNGPTTLYGTEMIQGITMSNDLRTQNCTGSLCSMLGKWSTTDGYISGNGWQPQYGSKLNSQDVLDAVNGSNNIASLNAITFMGNPVSSAANIVPTMGIVPTVGPRPIHRRTKIKLCLVGSNNSVTDYDISLVKFKEDYLHPDYMDNVAASNNGFLESAVRAQGYCQQRALGVESYVGGAITGSWQGEALKTYQALAAPFSWGPDCSISKDAYKNVVFLGKRRVKINPTTTVDKDSGGNAHYVDLTFDWNEKRNYAWVKPSNTDLLNEVPKNIAGTLSGFTSMGFSTGFNYIDGTYPTVAPKDRIYLLIRARTPLVYGVKQGSGVVTAGVLSGAPQALGGDANWADCAGNASLTNVPSFDIQITNSFVRDA